MKIRWELALVVVVVWFAAAMVFGCSHVGNMDGDAAPDTDTDTYCNPTWTEHTVDGTFDNATSVCAADVDGDGDMDVLGAARTDSTIAWWESDCIP